MKSRRELMFGAAGAGVGALMVATAAQARSLSASLSPAVMGVGEGYVTVSVSGGVAPYTYQWVRISGSSDIEASNPDSPVTEFQWNGPWNGPPRLSAWVCHVTDSANDTATTGSVHVGYGGA
jgi:SprB repeat